MERTTETVTEQTLFLHNHTFHVASVLKHHRPEEDFELPDTKPASLWPPPHHNTTDTTKQSLNEGEQNDQVQATTLWYDPLCHEAVMDSGPSDPEELWQKAFKVNLYHMNF